MDEDVSRDRAAPPLDLRASRGVQLGDNNTQYNYFGAPTPRRRRLLVAGALAAVLLLSLGMCEPVRTLFNGDADAPSVQVADAAEDWPCEQTSGWVVPDRAAQPPDPRWARSRPETYQKWLDSHRAVAAGRSTTLFTMRGSSATALVIDDVWITVVARRAPLAGRPVRPECGGGPLTRSYVQVDLDALPLGEAVSLRRLGSPAQAPASRAGSGDKLVDLPFTVSGAEITRLELVATTAACDCDWRVAVSWVNGDRRGRVERPDGGRSFRLSAVPRDDP